MNFLLLLLGDSGDLQQTFVDLILIVAQSDRICLGVMAELA